MARERRDFNRVSGIRNPSLIVIATEGEKTEQQYFEGLQSKCQEAASRIKIKLLDSSERGSGNSAAKYVLGQLDKYKKEFKLNQYDELCMVIDRDKQSLKEPELSKIAKQCSQKEYLLALSNPAFELWLILHIKDLNSYSIMEKEKLLENKNQYLKKELKHIMAGFNPSNLKFDDFWGRIHLAIDRAEALDTLSQDRWPNELGSRVYLLVKKIMLTIDMAE